MRRAPEELAQETFVAILRGIQRYEPRATFRTYLFDRIQDSGQSPPQIGPELRRRGLGAICPTLRVRKH